MKRTNWVALLLPFLIILAGGMAVGSIHNAQMRDVIPGITTPMGAILIGLSFVQLIVGLLLWRYYERLSPLNWLGAVVASVFVIILGVLNAVTTIQAEGSLDGWLFHEYLGPVVGLLQLIKLFMEPRPQVEE